MSDGENKHAKFARRLVRSAMETWEPQEIAQLLLLLFGQLQLDTDDSFLFLQKCGVCDPLVLGSLRDRCPDFTSLHFVSLLMADGVASFLQHVEDAMEQKLIDIQDMDTRHYLIELSDGWNDNSRLEFCARICEYTRSKSMCGVVVNGFLTYLDDAEALSFAEEVVSRDFFRDLRGKLVDFLAAVPRIKQSLSQLLQERERIGNNGELVDSDEDENGNLKGFIDDSEDDNSDDDDDDGSNSNDDDVERFFDGEANEGVESENEEEEEEEEGSRRKQHLSDSDSDSDSSDNDVLIQHQFHNNNNNNNNNSSDDEDSDRNSGNNNENKHKAKQQQQQQQMKRRRVRSLPSDSESDD